VPVRARRPATQSGTYPNASTGVAADEKGGEILRTLTVVPKPKSQQYSERFPALQHLLSKASIRKDIQNPTTQKKAEQ
jgi:hypothetical protein